MSSDEGDGDNWPGVRERVLASDIIFFASPTWLGKISSVAQRALERMEAMLSEQNEQGQMIACNRVAGFVVTGNEDGAKNCISELASAAVELGLRDMPALNAGTLEAGIFSAVWTTLSYPRPETAQTYERAIPPSRFSARYVPNIGKVLFHVLGCPEAGTAAG